MALKSALVVALIAVTLLPFLRSVPNANFGGRWTLDYGQSEGGPAGTSTSYDVQHVEPSITVTRTIDGTADTSTFRTDGAETTQSLVCCGEAKVRALWKDRALLRELRWDGGWQRDVWTLSPDGRILTIVRIIKQGDQQESTLKLVFQRQGDE